MSVQLQSTRPASRTEQLVEALNGQLFYPSKLDSFSPLDSNIGLSFAGGAGIDALHLHYNRQTTTISPPFLQVQIDGQVIQAAARAGALEVSQHAEKPEWNLQTHVTFAQTDVFTWSVHVAHRAGTFKSVTVKLSPWDATAQHATSNRQGDGWTFSARLPARDKRDPSPTFGVQVGCTARASGWMVHADAQGATWSATLAPGQSLDLVLTIAVGFDSQPLTSPPSVQPNSTAPAAQWIERALGNLPMPKGDDAVRRTFARAVWTLLSNRTQAPGRLGNAVSLFPNRGRYPCHYLWDSFFQNLAMEMMDVSAAVDSQLLLTRNIEPDGKIPHFVCSTWNRPGTSQNPLVGWGVWRLYQLTGDRRLIEEALPALVANVDWWFAQRDPEGSGLLTCFDPFELWDDTPRLDHGPIKAADLNTYISIQMGACAEMAGILGRDTLRRKMLEQHRRHQQRMLDVLYRPEQDLFLDWHIETQRPLALRTPACFIPLLADLPLAADAAKRIIEKHLLNPLEFFGVVPFPVVAYGEPVYDADQWWRGPTWPPIAYLMLEVLGRHGYSAQRTQAARRFFDVMTRDGALHELFDSQTGTGLGAVEQGWTAAIYIRLASELGLLQS